MSVSAGVGAPVLGCEDRPEETRVEDPTATKEPEQGLRRMRGPCPAPVTPTPGAPTVREVETERGVSAKS